LIGGATTSTQHTAVKIAPHYEQPTLHVQDASRVVAALSSVLDAAKRPEFDRANRATQERLRLAHASRMERPLVALHDARSRAPRLVFDAAHVSVPEFTGRRVLHDVPLSELAELIDWTFFFTAWELRVVPRDPRQPHARRRRPRAVRERARAPAQADRRRRARRARRLRLLAGVE
jgi:5-methyltetrahydrofolate--homocysteine methyltransferase